MKAKNIFILIVSTLFGFTFNSCETEENLQPEGLWELSSPTILTPSSEAVIMLDEATPEETITISWEDAKSSAGFGVTYEVLIDKSGDDFSTPLFVSKSSSQGKGTSLSISHETLNKAIVYSGLPSNAEANLTFTVKAYSLSKSSVSSNEIKVVTFEKELLPEALYLSGSATENGEELSQAIALRQLTDSNGAASNIYEIYTSLVAGETYKFYGGLELPALQYGGSDGNLVSFGDAIVAENSGQFRIKVDLDNNSYELLEIKFWSMVGEPISGGWGGDKPLAYQGGGVWKASIELLKTGGFLFRANGDWSYLLKRVVGTSNTLVMESDASSQGLSYEDIPNDLLGQYFVTLDLSANNYTYSFEKDNTVVEPIDTPTELYLFENGTMIEEFTSNGDVFGSDRFIAMQAANAYTLNSAIDGSGTSYSVNGLLAESAVSGGDMVEDALTLVESSDTFTLNSDRALKFSIDFSKPELTWTYYNFKLFHWQDWDSRNEFVMTYVHPNTYTVTQSLTSGYDSKFISPWTFDLGSDDPSSLTGNLINGGGSNLVNITTDGTYTVTVVLADDYQTGTYEFTQ